MQKIIFIFALSLVIERALEQISEIVPKNKRKKIMWFLATFISVVITTLGKIGVLKELCMIHGESNVLNYLDYFLTGLVIGSGSEPVHSLLISLECKKEELKKKSREI